MLDFKKEFKNLYQPKKAELVEVPAFNYITISGAGDPNEEMFQKKVEALYTVAYTLKMSYKTSYKIDFFKEYVVAPLEGIWTTVDNKEYDGNKNKLAYRLLINTPIFITKENLEWAKEVAFKKTKNNYIEDIDIIEFVEGNCVQTLHVGSFDEEKSTVELIEKFLEDKELRIDHSSHHEIYLSDFRKTLVDKRKTVLRYKVSK